MDAELSGAFPPASRTDWLKLVDGVLKGAPYERRMVTRTLDGIALDALPERRPQARPIAGRPAGAPWGIIARIDHDDPDLANRQVLEDLAGGADGATLVFASAPSARGFGLPGTTDALARTLEGVMLDLVTLRVEAGQFRARDVALALAAVTEAHGLEPASLDLRFGLDPIGDLAALGSSMLDWETLAARLGQTVNALRTRGFTAPMVRADGRIHHGAGASDAQELAAVLATGIAYLRALEGAGLSIEQAAPLIEATLTADVEQIATMAKMRAMRQLWSAALAACGLPSAPPLRLHAETAWRSLTRRDPHVNLLRGTIAAFAAGAGGADSLTVLPFTEALGLPDAFARRLARNTQVILIEESNIHRVADPGAGAGAIEEATEKLAATAWELFRAVERDGGMVEALLSGSWQQRLAATRAARASAVATRRQPITGTSEYPQLAGAPVTVLAPARPATPPAPLDGAIACEPLVPGRIAEPYERLRDAAERASTPPTVFLATLGTVAAFTARAGFARGLFEAGGIAAAGGAVHASVDELVAAFRASGTTLACLCSSDEIYAEQAAPAARALKAAGARFIYLAGRPAEAEAALREAGVDDFIVAGGNAVETLTQAHAKLGIVQL